MQPQMSVDTIDRQYAFGVPSITTAVPASDDNLAYCASLRLDLHLTLIHVRC